MNTLHVVLFVCLMYCVTGFYYGKNRECKWNGKYYQHGDTYLKTRTCKAYQCKNGSWEYYGNGCKRKGSCYREGDVVYYSGYLPCKCTWNGIRCPYN